VYEIKEFAENGCSPFADWFNGLDAVTAARVDRFIRRMGSGNFGAAKPRREGVSELRMDFGPGCRAYYGLDG
jgi:putative addiction module killer protein